MSTNDRLLDNVIISLDHLRIRWLQQGNIDGADQCLHMINTINQEKQKEHNQ